MGHGIIVNNATVLRAATTSFKVLFADALKEPNGNFDKAMRFMMESSSNGAQQHYGWLGTIPGMTEWLDERPHSTIEQFGHTIRNKDFANGIKMPLNWLDDDQLGQMTPLIKSLATAYKRHVFSQFLWLLQNGTSQPCYDGSYFFSATHSEGASGTQKNYLTGTDSTLTADHLAARIAEMQEYKDDRGEVMGIYPTHLIVAPAYEVTAKEIVAAGRKANGQDNVLAGSLEIMTLPGLTTSTNWVLADLSQTLKPFIKQNRRPLSFSAMDKIDDELVYNRREVRYGADYRGGYGYGFWQMMYLNNGA